MNPWKILVVDDEEGIHGITRMIFRDYEFEQRPVELLSAMNSAEALEQLQHHPDIALILLDVVMETEHAGLQLVETIRHQLKNRDVRIILRTGHPGYAPEAQVIIHYDINDYLSKAELSASRLLTSVIVALRSYRDIMQARQVNPPLPPAADTDSDIRLHTLAEQLQQQAAPALKQSRRLHQLELNPVAHELARDLYAHQLRLNNSLQLLHPQTETPGTAQTVRVRPLLDEVLHTFLPQSRQQGWLLDYRVDEQLPELLPLCPERLRALLLTGVELALLQADGQDLRLSLEQPTPGQLQVQISLWQGQPVYSKSPWATLLRRQLQQLTQGFKGRFTEIDEGGLICCQLELAAV